MAAQNLTNAIQRRAYEIWIGEGCPHGRDRIHWLRAEAEIRERFAAEHCPDRCKTGLHEKPSQPRNQRRLVRRTAAADANVRPTIGELVDPKATAPD